jgi:hypothetical protein
MGWSRWHAFAVSSDTNHIAERAGISIGTLYQYDAHVAGLAGSVAAARRRAAAAARTHVRGYLDAESFARSATASCTVVMNCAGKMMVEFFSVAISAIVWSVRS